MEAEARNARRLSRALIGIAGSVGAFGGVVVNLALRQSFLSNGTADAAYVAFIALLPRVPGRHLGRVPAAVAQPARRGLTTAMEVAVSLSRRPEGRAPAGSPTRPAVAPAPAPRQHHPELLPLDAGEQYRFGFAMNACIGCHSCEVACAEQNGLPAGHRVAAGRRDRGRRPPATRSASTCRCRATTASTRPASSGCPTNAYEKLANGVVAHHADDCIGCQYCTWNCPYSVPAFQPDRRIVTKCDMCLPRLDGGLDAGVRRRLPDPRHHRREGRRRRVARRPRRRPTRPQLPRVDLTLSTTRIELPARRAARDVRGQRLEPAPRAPALAARVADARSARSRWASAPPPATARRPAAGRRRWPAPALVGALAPPRPPGDGVEGAAQPAPLVAQPRGRAARRSTPRWPPARCVVPAARRRSPPSSARRRVRLGPPLHRARPAGVGLARSPSCASSPPRSAARPAAHRAPRRSPPPASASRLAATAANWARLAAAGRPAVARARSASSCAGSGRLDGARAGSPPAVGVAVGSPGGRPSLVFVALAVGEVVGRWLFYVTVVPLNMPGSFWRGTAGSHR